MVPDADNGWLMYPPLGEAAYRNVGLWLDGVHRCNLVLATVKGAKDLGGGHREALPCRRFGNMLCGNEAIVG